MSGRKRQRRRKGPTRPRLPVDLRKVDWEAVDWTCIDQCMARFDAGSMAVMLAAAADSPGGGHRLPSLTVLWLRCLARPSAGAVSASPTHLPRLLSAARSAAPQLQVLEDYQAADPRLVVRFPAAGQRFRVHPGSSLNPVLTLRSVAATAEAIDDFILNRHGFRLTDLVEVALRYSDHRVGVLASARPDNDLALDLPDPPGEDLRGSSHGVQLIVLLRKWIEGAHEVEALDELELVRWLEVLAEVHDAVTDYARRVQVFNERGAVHPVPAHAPPPGLVAE